MILCSWNIRGFNKPLKQNGVRSLIKKHGIDICCILENKLKTQKTVERIMSCKFAGWDFANNLAVHKGGRILILWNVNTVDVEVIACCSQTMHCRVKCKISSKEIFVSFVYGLHSNSHRKRLWSSLERFGSGLSMPWLISGDFNCVLKIDERIGGNEPSPNDIRDFSDCCQLLGISDVSSVGSHFTWTNNSVTKPVWSKLDRTMGNHLWFHSYGYALTNFLPPGCLSDHSLCVINTNNNQTKPKRSFKFFNMWASHPSFQAIVKEVWDSSSVYGVEQYKLCRKLKALKKPLKKLNRLEYNHISRRAAEAREELVELQTHLQENITNQDLQSTLDTKITKCRFLCEAERSYLSQKAKCDYLNLADKSNKFFFGLVKKKSKRNHIAAVKMEDGNLTESYEHVANTFIRYYTRLLGTKDHCDPLIEEIISEGPVVTNEQADGLIREVTRKEIKDALNCIGNEKSPGPDGYNSMFFKKAWPTVGDSVVLAVMEFFATGKLLKQVNHTNLALIPKSAHACEVNDYRPIACCNILYKIISKIIAIRVAGLLDSLIDKAQSAFVEGRNIGENIHLAESLMRHYNRTRTSPKCLLKVDLRKAFDSVDWGFLEGILINMKFPDKFVKWIMVCVSSTSYSLSINGEMQGLIKGEKGLRQGDPLSPFLFVLCLEYLSRLIKRHTTDSNFNFHPKCKQDGITHLAFADDLMIFCRADLGSVRVVKDCLEEFGRVSGLKANSLKSNVYLAGISSFEVAEIENILQFQRGEFPFRYLGVPLSAAKLKAVQYSPLLDSISAAISSWSGPSLSYAGRMELIRAVIQGKCCYWLSIFNIPSTVIYRIQRQCSIFLWGSKVARIVWEDLCFPKKEGGLGFKDLKTWNKALLVKELWNLHQKKETLWIQWVHSVYLKDFSIWDWSPNHETPPFLKAVARVRDILLERAGSSDVAIELLKKCCVGPKLNTSLIYDELRKKQRSVNWSSLVWNSANIPKQSFNLWLTLKGRIATKDRLGFLHINQDCVFCGDHQEDCNHLFFHCHYTMEVWRQIRQWMGITRNLISIQSSLNWLK